jgi:hypothetical protein
MHSVPRNNEFANILELWTGDCSTIMTVELRIPKFCQAELKTHGLIRGNATSSRAIPVHKQIDNLRKSPVLPKFGKDRPGMVSTTPLNEEEQVAANAAWLDHLSASVNVVEYLRDTLKIHKQWASRLLEPWMWSTNILTSTITGWSHFFNLRTAEDAQPDFRKVVRRLFNTWLETSEHGIESVFDQEKTKTPGWSMPYILASDVSALKYMFPNLESLSPMESRRQLSELLCRISAARCARGSYANHGTGEIDVEKDLALANQLLENGHLTPFEHQVTPLSRSYHPTVYWDDHVLNPYVERTHHPVDGSEMYVGWKSARKILTAGNGDIRGFSRNTPFTEEELE